MKRFSGLFVLAVTVSSASGCGWLWGDHGYFRDRSNDYLEAREAPDLQLPEGVNAKSMDPLLPIPGNVESLNLARADRKVPRPQAIEEVGDSSLFSIEEHDGQRWLLAQHPLAEVWPPVRQFFLDSGFRLAQERPNNGEFVTEWQPIGQLASGVAGRLTLAGSGQQEIRLRVRIEPGITPDVSEVHVASARRPAGSQAEVAFPDPAGKAPGEAGLLDDLLANLSSGKNDSVSLLASSYDAPQRVRLEADGSGNPVLNMVTDFNRAWSSVGRALQKGDVRVDDLNRSTGLYYVNLAQGARKADERPGFFSRLFGGGKKKDDDSQHAQRYQVRLSTVGEEVQVTVEQGIDNVAPSEVSRRILTLIQNNLG